MPMRGPVTISGTSRRSFEPERRTIERQAVVLAGDRQRLTELARPGAELSQVLHPAPLPLQLDAGGRLQRANQDRLGTSSPPQTRFRHQWMPYER